LAQRIYSQRIENRSHLSYDLRINAHDVLRIHDLSKALCRNHGDRARNADIDEPVGRDR
jgi:hypothetical protein